MLVLKCLMGCDVKHYYTGDWVVYRKIISNEKLTQGKKYATKIEQTIQT